MLEYASTLQVGKLEIEQLKVSCDVKQFPRAEQKYIQTPILQQGRVWTLVRSVIRAFFLLHFNNLEQLM